MNSVRTLETEPIIKSAIRAECTIGREVIVKIPKKLESLTATINGQYTPSGDIDGYSNVIVDVPERIPVIESLLIIENGQYKPSEGVDGFSDVSVNVPEKVPDIEGLTVTANGIYTADGDGFNPVTVVVPERVPITESLSVTENGNYQTPAGVDGYNSVTVAVPERIPVTESLSVTENGTYEPSEGIDGYDRVVVDVPPTIPEIEALTVTEDGVYTSSGDGYNPVTVNTGVGTLRQEIASAETASGCSPLVDGLTALTTYANEVTGQEDETLSDAVETLASKYGKAEFNPFAQIYTGENLFTSAVLPENLTIDFEGNTVMQSMKSMFRLCTGLKNLTLKNLNPSIAVSIETIFGWSSLETVTLDNCNIAPRSISGWVRNSNIRHVYGEVDMTSCTSAVVFVFQCPDLETFSFKPNTINVAIQTIQNCPLSDDSLISLGNGLVQGAGKSMSSVDNRHKTRMNAILGNNVDGTFIADENGSMTLMDFITTVKGWTVT